MINIDLTTNNTVYNSVGAQAQWIQHRFGRRNYPLINIDTDNILKFIRETNDSLNFISCYGDPSCHPDILNIIEKVETGKCVINTHLNFKNDQLIELLNQKNSYVVVPLFGINDLCDKVLLHSDWKVILDNLKKLSCSICVEFYVYEHNKHQLIELEELSKSLNFDIKVKKGIATHPDGFSTIVNESGEWLYDVFEENSKLNKWKTLEKTVYGYNSLIQYIKPIRGNSILSKPNVFKIEERNNYSNSISVSVTGDVFPSFELHQIFSNALCDDWDLSYSKILNFNKTAIRDDFKYICSSVIFLSEYLKKENNIHKKLPAEILTNLTNSDI